MIPSHEVVDLSRLQFAMTAMYHFLFVPLTLGLAVLLGIMETVYVITKKSIWRKMTQYWGILFGINFAMGVATGVTMEFQFGTNWAYYAHYVGDIFGTPLAIEGMMAFFLEATFVGLFFFGWNRLSKGLHLMVTWLLALGTNLSALWILVANGWMQHPVGAYFDFETMRMQVGSFFDVLFNPVAQAKFVHTISAGYVVGAMFVVSLSAYFLLRGKSVEMAKRSMVVGLAFGLAASLSVVTLGDESGYMTAQNQKMKIAAMEGMWHTEKAPADLTLIGFPDQAQRETHIMLKVPYLLGLIATRSISEPIQGITELVSQDKARIERGMKAYGALQILEQDANNTAAKAQFNQYKDDLGYGLLLRRYTYDVANASDALVEKAAWSTVPQVAPLFWGFRVMVACGFFFILLFAVGFYWMLRRRLFERRWFLYLALFSLPLPWIANLVGWFVAEYGRQPWVIDGVLPTFLGTSSLSAHDVKLSLTGFIIYYSLLAVVEVFLMVKYIRKGPEGALGYGNNTVMATRNEG